MALAGGFFFLRAQSGAGLEQRAPVNPNFTQYRNDYLNGRTKHTIEDGMPLCYAPPPVRLQLFALAYNVGNFLRTLALPRHVSR